MRSLYQHYKSRFERYATNIKLTEEVVRQIRSRVAKGERQIDIARDLGINYRTINTVVLRRTWKHVD